MQVFNATPWPSPDSTIPALKSADRGFWQESIDPAAGGALPDGAAIPELSRPRLAAVIADVVKSYGGRIMFDIESASSAQHSTDPDVFADRLTLLVRLATLAKQDGATSVGFFGFPFSQPAERAYRSTLDTWAKDSAALAPALSLCDALYPCLYAGQRGAGGAGGSGTVGQVIEYGLWCSMAAYAITTAQQLYPGKAIYPVISGRAGFEGTDGGFMEKGDFMRRNAFLRSMPVAGLVYWDAAFQHETWTSLSSCPLYNLLWYTAKYDPTWPPDSPNWLK